MRHTGVRGQAVVEVVGLSKRFGNHLVLQDVTFSVGPGVHALLGPNGAGKTTLVNILSTLLQADGGAVRVLGHDVTSDAAAVRELIALTGQHVALDPVLTGRENLVLLGRLLGMRRGDAERRAAQLVAEFDLEDAAAVRVGRYSGGMRRRLDLAATLLRTPQVLFLDEPTTGLDTRSRLALWKRIRSLAGNGTTVLLTTQYLEEADQLADDVLVLDSGRIVARGTPSELKSRVGEAVLTVTGSDGTSLREATTAGTVAALADDLIRLAVSHPDASVALRRPTLDDAFLALTGHGVAVGEEDGRAVGLPR